MRLSGFGLAIVAVSMLQVGCRKNEEEEAPQTAYQPNNQYGQNQQTGQQPQTTDPNAAGQTNPIGAIISDPNALQNILAGVLAGTQASLGVATGGEIGPIQSGIQMQAGQVAKGARADGDLMSASLQENGHAQASFTLQPGRCYTVIGFGGFGVFDYQLNITTAPPLPPQVLAQSASGNNQPVIGANDQCIRNPSPLPMQITVDMHVIKGQGMVGAQVYSK